LLAPSLEFRAHDVQQAFRVCARPVTRDPDAKKPKATTRASVVADLSYDSTPRATAISAAIAATGLLIEPA
jgi:hypothetical protein